MKKITHSISLLLVFAIVLSLNGMAFATTSQPSDSYTKLSYKNLPSEIKAIISEDSDIYIDCDGNYTVFENTPKSNNSDYQINSSRSTPRYAPNGGTYDGFPNYPLATTLLSYSYVPAIEVLNWTVGSTDNAVRDIIAWNALGHTVNKIMSLLKSTYALTVPSWFITVVVTAGEVERYCKFNLPKDKAQEKLKESGNIGIEVKCYSVYSSPSYAIVKVINTWGDHPYVDRNPLDTNADWHAGVYNAYYY